MKKIRKYGKATLLLIIIAAILGLAVYGLISLIKNLSTKDSEANDFVAPTNSPVSSGKLSPVESESPPDNNGSLNPQQERIVAVDAIADSIIIYNSGNEYTASVTTGENIMTVFIPECSSMDIGFWETDGSEMFKGYSISEVKNGILVTVRASKDFTLDEIVKNDGVEFIFKDQLNKGTLVYRNDLSRTYMNIQKARLCSESDSFIKNYTEVFDEDTLTYTISIAQKYMPSLKDEFMVLNDGLLKSIDISNVDGNVVFVFKALKRIEIYPNTRDYDAAFTFIPPKQEGKKLIVIDPGHGGMDGGAVSADKSILEKDIVLVISNIVAENLMELGYEVLNLREEDIFLGLMERTDIANLSGADAIISIHINSYDVEHVNGATTMYKDSKDLAEAIQASLISATGAKDMGSVKYNNMSILNRAEMESVIVETGFLTNEAEAALLNTYDYQVKVANGITAGIDSYFKGE